MDILSHCTSGIAIASCASAFTPYKVSTKFKMLLVGGIAGAFPDFDALSLWSKFDQLIGIPLNLASGKAIYFGKYWYSHHAFLHSILAALLFALLSLVIIKKIKKDTTNHNTFLITHKVLFISIVLSYCTHLLEDMPTPACVWGGVNFLFPSSNYIGGYGKIWWWNNYDLFLIINVCTLLNILMHTLNYFYKVRLSILTSIITGISITIFIYQINTRGYDFSYTGFAKNYSDMEKVSKEIQKRELGDPLYNMMLSLDNVIPLNF